MLSVGMVIVMLILFRAPLCSAQPPIPLQVPPPPPSQLFSPNGVSLNLSFAQAFSSNWVQGEENILTLKFSTRSIDERLLGPLKIRTTTQVAIGANYKDDSIAANTLRVSDNEIFGEGVFVYPIRWIADPYFSASIRTPITESFRYSGPNRFRTANFWDPVTSQQGMGFTYALTGRSGMFNTRIGMALQQIRAEHNTMLTDDYTTPKVVEAYSARSGIEFVNEAMLRGDSTVSYVGRLGLFGTFKDLNVWTVRWENETRFRIWKSIGLTWTFNVLHDIKQTRRTQFKQAILLGLIQDF